jgi:GSH-dependent disulfide-bond oxidoreductase
MSKEPIVSSSSVLTLYGMGSPNVRKVVILLEELELPYTLRHVAVFKGEQFTPEFLALNPLGKVPVLLDPALGRPIAESAAILLWLAEHHRGFLPEAAPARYEVLQWLMVQMASIGPMLGQLNHFQIVSKEREPYAYGRYRTQAEQLYRLIEARLTANEWLAGGAYSIADIATYPWMTYLERHGFDRSQFPSLLRWRDAIGARAAVGRAGKRMDEAFTALSTHTRRSATHEDLDRFFGRTQDMPAADYSSVTRA